MSGISQTPTHAENYFHFTEKCKENDDKIIVCTYQYNETEWCFFYRWAIIYIFRQKN